MAVNSVNSNLTVAAGSYESVSFSAEITKTETSVAMVSAKKADSNGAAAVYEKSANEEQPAKTAERKVDMDTINRLKADAEKRNESLRGIVEKLLLKQGGTSLLADGKLPTEKLADFYRGLEVDEETRLQAQKDIAEDGYWGVEQTSDRMVDFAKALAGDDPEAAKKMLEAIKQGFEEAEKAWGEKLPQLSQDTMKATEEKMNKWIESLGGSSAPAQDSSSGSNSVTAVAAKQTTTSIKVSASYTRTEAAAASYQKSMQVSDAKK
ncbi:MAG: hypothetical protein MJ131_05400 [Lachnospiraceae bacterium]|nr:hypothetical protein [Lachnospiraceae bacterium]